MENGGRAANTLQAFQKIFGTNDMLAYLSMMATRIIELKRVLKPTGSIYLHCDPAASHYLKILIDAVFSPGNFKNEIIWKRTSGHSDARRYGSVHDTILFYAADNNYHWNQVYQPYEKEYITKYYRYIDDYSGRRFMSGDLGTAGLQGGGYVYDWKGVTREWRVPLSTMQELDGKNKLYYTRNKIPRIKRFLDEAKGLPVQDVWTDMEALRSWHKEKLGYPTQKPLSLLERIITASSNKNDIVLDPFCGCGTSIEAAEKLGRKWIGIDITFAATNLIKYRLNKNFGEKVKYDVIGEPTTLAEALHLAETDPYQFQWWALGLVKARPSEQKKGADRGIDGRLFFQDEGPKIASTKQIIISVKAGKTNASHVRDLRGVVAREKAAIGVLISMQDPTSAMRKEAADSKKGDFYYRSPWWNRDYPKIQLLTIKELLEGSDIDKPPSYVDVTFERTQPQKPYTDKKKGEQDLFESG